MMLNKNRYNKNNYYAKIKIVLMIIVLKYLTNTQINKKNLAKNNSIANRLQNTNKKHKI